MLRPGMRERADFVGAYVHDHYRGGGRGETARLMGEAQDAYRDRAARRNPSDSFGEEVIGSALGTVIGLVVLSVALVAFCPRPDRSGCRACRGIKREYLVDGRS